MVDFLGKEIHVGALIVYPGRQGSNMWMNKAIVTKVGSKSLSAKRIGRTQFEAPVKNVTILETGRVVVLPNTW